ncbi:MAG: ExeM/NucH family extracellular endonuclease [Candidatus Limnocylindria bacterium]
MPMQRASSLFLAIALMLGAMVPFLAPTPARAVSETLVISQVYGGGGNSGATFTHDFIELFNRGDSTVDLAGMSLQYASATGTGNFGANTGQLTELSGSIPAGGYFLVQQASQAAVGAPLPTADLADATPIAMAAGSGKVALVSDAVSLGCNGGSMPCNANQLARIVDLVGYGTANFFEGTSAASGIGSTTSAQRIDAGCTDTDQNGTDFASAAVAPRNSATAQNPCDTTTPTNPSGSGSADPSTVLAGETTTLTVIVTPGTNPDSEGMAVSADLTAIGGSADQAFTGADTTFSFEATVSAGTSPGDVSLPVAITDSQDRTGATTIDLTIASDDGPVGGAVVISQVYGGGGNANATFTHDFIELYNRTDAPISLAGWSVQYASSAGTTWQVTPLDGSIAAGGYYLIQQAQGSGGTTPLPTPDATGTILMASSSGKVALSSATTTLSGKCPLGEPVVDFVGYGSANCFEGGGPTVALSNTTAAIRDDGGATDTGDNAEDFTTGAPNPRNSGGADPDPIAVCDVEESDLTWIYEVQGDGASTPMPGESVIVRGVVTADFTSGGDTGIPANQGLRGFFIEAIAADRDDDSQTSEGVFVFDFDAIFDDEIGDLVHVAGTVGEFGGVTQISSGDLDVCDDTGVDATLPAPAVLPLPMAPDLRAEEFEPLESMRVAHEELTVIEFFQLERFGEVRLSAEGVLQTPTNVFLPGSEEAVELAEFNAAVNIVLDDGRTGQNLNRLDSPDLLPYVEAGETLRIGDQLIEHTTVLHFNFGQWKLQPVDIDEITEELAENRTRPRPESAPEVGGTLNVASFNVLNYFDGDGQGGGFPNARGATTASELERQTEKLVDAITRLDADVLGLIEIENDGGELTATRTLVDAINAELGAELYRFVDTGEIGTDAIKQAFIYDSRTVRPVGEWAILTSEVDPRFDDNRSRPALAQTFTQLGTGERVTVVVNHFKSKGQSGLNDPNDPDFDQGDGQGFWNHTRTQSALALADWLDTNPTQVQSLGTLIIGDLNAYGREDPIVALEKAGYVDQLIKFTDGTPYTYTFDGQQGTLDTALAKGNLATRITGADVWHINADEVPAIDYQESIGGPGNSRFRTPEIAELYYDPSAFRSSDHDPVLVGLELGRRNFPGQPGG